MSCTFKYLTTTLLIELHGYSKICYKNEPGTRKVKLRMKTLSKHPSKNTVTINVLQLFAFITTLVRKRAFFYLYLNSHRAHFSVFLMKIPSKPALKNIEITILESILGVSEPQNRLQYIFVCKKLWVETTYLLFGLQLFPPVLHHIIVLLIQHFEPLSLILNQQVTFFILQQKMCLLSNVG